MAYSTFDLAKVMSSKSDYVSWVPTIHKTVPSSSASESLGRGAATALDGILDGVLLLAADGQILLLNHQAEKLCGLIQSDPCIESDAPFTAPDPILTACQLLHDNRDRLAGRSLPARAVLTIYPNIKVRISLLEPESDQDPLFLVTLEDQRQTSITQAMFDQWLYGLTEREGEVWMLRLQDYSYQEIADKLYLSINTVKKHMKTILAKQEQCQFGEANALAA